MIKKNKKIIILLLSFVTLIVLFFLYGKLTQNNSENISPSTEDTLGIVDKSIQEDNDSDFQQKPADSTANPVIEGKIYISEEDIASCKQWQAMHGYSADGVCEGKPYTDQYDSDSSSETNQNNDEKESYLMKTYTNSIYNISFEIPSNMTCQEYTNIYTDYKKVDMRCGHVNLNGGVSDWDAGSISLYIDNGSSNYRTQMQGLATESYTAKVGDNNFYDFSNGHKSLLRLFADDYVLEVPIATSLIPPSHIDLSTLTL